MTSRRVLRSWFPAVAATAAVITAVLAPALADDRDLLKLAQEKPYVFIVLDSSGSMNWQPGGDLFAPANADDPNSKMYQAKSALYRVMTDPALDGIHWGFGTYNQDAVLAYRKHYVYRARTSPSWVGSPQFLSFPQAGQIQVFGDHCIDESDGDTNCDDFTFAGDPVATDDMYGRCSGGAVFFDPTNATSRLRLSNFPVLGDTGAIATDLWIRVGSGQRYRLRFNSIITGALGDASITVRLILTPYDSSCNAGTAVQRDIVYDAAYTVDGQGRPLTGSSDMVTWTQNASRATDPWDLQDTETTNTCQASGNPLVNPDRNNDSTTDQTGSTYFIKTKTINDPLRPSGAAAPIFTRGDFVPLDWRDEEAASWTAVTVPASHRLNNRDFILRRLAPNYTPAMAGTPDFRIANYFQDHPAAIRPTNATSGIKPLTAYTDVPPIIASGSTPLGNSIRGFTTWFDSWKPYAEAPASSGGDDNFICRTTNLLILSDGDESCYGGTLNNTTQQDSQGDYNPCWAAGQLWKVGNRNVKTYIVGFGVAAAAGNSLSCIANQGGTDAVDYDGNGTIDGPGVVYPGNEDDLVTELTKILTSIRSGAATFASAAVPSVQADAADKVVLTEFSPVKDEPLWPGRVYAFVKPVPISPISKKPDLTAQCADETDTACFAWEAQYSLVENQVKPNSVSGDYIGATASQRRVYYSEQPGLALPLGRHYFEQTDGTTPIGQKRDLWNGLRIPYILGNAPSEAAAQSTANTTIDAMLKLKSVVPEGGSLIEFVMGDNFHSDPLALGSPSNSPYFRQDAGASLATACTDDQNDDDRRYTRFAFKQERRRRMLALGTNEGALHFFDIGIFRVDSDPAKPGKFTNGTGNELIAHIPRQVLPQIMSLYDPATTEPEYTVDGRTLATDVLIDPIHSGYGSGNPPTACDRRWRTVVLGGLREGGADATLAERPRSVPTNDDYPVGSYYALDVTEPDPVLDLRASDPDPNHLPFYVPQIDAAHETVPTCAGNGEGSALPTGCGPVAFGTPLWEFTDSIDGIRLDEDDNGHIDMALTWSSANTGRMRVCTANCANASLTDDVLEERFVAIFGGGIDPDNRNIRGNWLYIVDIETGQAIYKNRLRGSAAAEPAAVDLDLDGYLDRIYIGDTYGLMYRVDLFQTIAGSPPSGGTKYPGLIATTITETDAGNVLHSRSMPRITDTSFRPRVVFNATGNVAADTTLSATLAAEPQSIYYPPSVLFVPAVEKYALAFGTGNRFDITSLNEPAGRFFVVTDDWAWSELPDATVDAARPTNRSSLFAVDLLTAADPNADYLSKRPVHTRGWAMLFEDDERLVSEPLAISGVLLFSMFTPVTTVTGDEKCEHSGQSRLFGVFVTNSQGLLDSNPNAPGSTAVRYRTVQDLTTSFYVEQTQTANQSGAGENYGEITGEERDILENVKKFLPKNCTFPPGYGVRINTRTSRGGVEGVAPIPLCVIESNFKEE